MPFLLLLTACAAIATAHLFRHSSKTRPIAVAIMMASALVATHSYAGTRYTSNNKLKERSERIIEFANRQPQPNNLYISKYTQIFELHGFHNIRFERAIAFSNRVLLHKTIGTYDNVYVIQNGRVRFEEGRAEETLLEGNDLAPIYELETIEKFSTIPYHFTRISRVVAIHPNLIDDVPPDAADTIKEYYEDLPDEDYQIWVDTLP